MAQLVARYLGVVEAVGSSPVTQTNIKAHRKLAFQWAFLLYIRSPALHGEIWSLTALAKHFTKSKSALSGPRYFKYNGEWLNDIRQRLGK